LPTGDGPEYHLCRCGASEATPFCDGTCERVGFDRTTDAEPGTREEVREETEGDDVVLTDDPRLCIGAGFCTAGPSSAWELVTEADDPEARARLVEIVHRCPSGRLQLLVAPSWEPDEPGLDPTVRLLEDGPLWVVGGVQLRSSDGTDRGVAHRATLCRCGSSSNRPFCDRTHERIGFVAPAARFPDRAQEPPAPAGPLRPTASP
jgi:CDGSH-type Zn-finger protein